MATNLYSPLPGVDVWPEYFVQFQEHLPPTTRLILYGLINIPIIVVFLHIFGQLVNIFPESDAFSTTSLMNEYARLVLAIVAFLPQFSSGFRTLARRSSMGMIL